MKKSGKNLGEILDELKSYLGSDCKLSPEILVNKNLLKSIIKEGNRLLRYVEKLNVLNKIEESGMLTNASIARDKVKEEKIGGIIVKLTCKNCEEYGIYDVINHMEKDGIKTYWNSIYMIESNRNGFRIEGFRGEYVTCLKCGCHEMKREVISFPQIKHN